MKRALLDVNVLIALLDPLHIHHGPAHGWFELNADHGWATCPITQNGYIRIVSQAGYEGNFSVRQACEMLNALTGDPRHVFWADSASLLDPGFCQAETITSSKRITDTYLLALARRHGGILVTLDGRLSVTSVADGAAHWLPLAR